MKLPGNFDELSYNKGYPQTNNDTKIDQGIFYQISQASIHYFKSQQWYIVYYCLLMFAAIIGMYELAECEIIFAILRLFTWVVFLIGEGLILNTQRILQRERLLAVKNIYWIPGLFYMTDGKKQEITNKHTKYFMNLAILLLFIITIALAFVFTFLYLMNLI